MSDADREEFSALVRGWATYLEWSRDTGAAALSRTEGRALDAPSIPATQPIEPAQRAPEAPAPAAPIAPSAPAPAASPAPIPAPRSEPAVEPSAPAPLFADARPSAPSLSAIPTTLLRGEARLRALAVVEQEARDCTRCRLCAGRTQSVFARGNPEAELLFVGEAPGADEDRVGKPFVGAAGRLLDRILGAMGMSEDDVYIANVVKCRPPNNRPPEDDEAAACGPLLDRQLAIVRPKVIVAWGRTPTRYLLRRNDAMGKLRGSWFELDGVPVLPTWHPAYLLRNPDAKKDTWADMKRVLEKMGRPLPTSRGDR